MKQVAKPTNESKPTNIVTTVIPRTRLGRVKLLIDLTAAGHPAVVIPKRKTLPELLRANPSKDFLRRLIASNN